jgi:hypothetical protein
VLKIVYPEPSAGETKRLSEIPVGTVFTGALGMFRGTFLRTYSEVVLLNNSNHTWGISKFSVVENYKEHDVELRFVK